MINGTFLLGLLYHNPCQLTCQEDHSTPRLSCSYYAPSELCSECGGQSRTYLQI